VLSVWRAERFEDICRLSGFPVRKDLSKGHSYRFVQKRADLKIILVHTSVWPIYQSCCKCLDLVEYVPLSNLKSFVVITFR